MGRYETKYLNIIKDAKDDKTMNQDYYNVMQSRTATINILKQQDLTPARRKNLISLLNDVDEHIKEITFFNM